MTNIDITPSKSLRVLLTGTELQVRQLAPRFVRVVGHIRDWWLTEDDGRTFLHCMSGPIYIGFMLYPEEALAVCQVLVPLGLSTRSPEPSTQSPEPKALQASGSAGNSPAPVSVSPAGAGVLEVAP